jgi:hypothetical protein
VTIAVALSGIAIASSLRRHGAGPEGDKR